MKEIEVEGKTVQEAIEKGLKKTGLSKDDVDIKILSEGKAGLFGLMGANPAKIKISSKGSTGEPAGEKRPGMAPSSQDLAETDSSVKDKLRSILNLMGVKGEVKTVIENEYIHADIQTEDSALLIGRKGQTLNSLEIIINMILAKKQGNNRIRATVDTAGYRERRRKTLEHIAIQTAQEVQKTGKSIQLEPMNPGERRIVHMSLKGNPDVLTGSDGQGDFRKVVISPAKPANPDEK